MAAEFNLTHNMKVGTISKNFKEVYGGSLRIYDNSNHIADENEPISKYASKGISPGSSFKAGIDLKVGNFEKRLADEFGIVVQVADADNKKLVDNDMTLKELKAKYVK
jgi:hypothetical protein